MNALRRDFGTFKNTPHIGFNDNRSQDDQSNGEAQKYHGVMNTTLDWTSEFAQIVHKAPGRLPDLVMSPFEINFLQPTAGTQSTLVSPTLAIDAASVILPSIRYTPRRPRLVTFLHLCSIGIRASSPASGKLAVASSFLDTLARMNRSPAPADPTAKGASCGDYHIKHMKSDFPNSAQRDETFRHANFFRSS